MISGDKYVTYTGRTAQAGRRCSLRYILLVVDLRERTFEKKNLSTGYILNLVPLAGRSVYLLNKVSNTVLGYTSTY